MQYHSLVFASALALSGLASAGQDTTASSEQQADDKVECIEAALSEELDGDQKNAFVQQCMLEKTAKRNKANDRNG